MTVPFFIIKNNEVPIEDTGPYIVLWITLLIWHSRYTKAFEPLQYSHCSDKWETCSRQYLFINLTGQLLYPLAQVEGVPEPSGNSGLQGVSAPADEEIVERFLARSMDAEVSIKEGKALPRRKEWLSMLNWLQDALNHCKRRPCTLYVCLRQTVNHKCVECSKSY